MAVIRTMGLSKRYKNNWAVDHLDLQVEQGDIYGFIGQNGAGKSTTLKLLCGLARPTEGEALIFDKPIRDQVARRRVGALIEQPGLYPDLSGRENLRLYAGLLGLDKPERQDEYLGIVEKRLEELEELLEELFLYTRLQGGSHPLECASRAALTPLWDALAEFYPQLEAAGVEPELRFDREDMMVWASPEALGRVYRNLIANALRHGGGGLTITGRDGEICFSNKLLPGSRPDTEHLFDRLYQSSLPAPKAEQGWVLPLCGS